MRVLRRSVMDLTSRRSLLRHLTRTQHADHPPEVHVVVSTYRPSHALACHHDIRPVLSLECLVRHHVSSVCAHGAHLALSYRIAPLPLLRGRAVIRESR